MTIQAGISANYARFEPKYSRFKKISLWLLITFLHLIQPLARLTGRISNGLTPWRNITYQLSQLFVLFRIPKIFTHWSEKWRPAGEWLQEIQDNLRLLDNKVVAGGEFDRWDFKNRIGMTAYARSLLTIEEHGMGKQMLKLKRRIVFSRLAMFILLILIVMSVFALKEEALVTFFVFALSSFMLILKILTDTSGALNSLWKIMKNLSADG